MKILGHRGDGTSNKSPELRLLRKRQGKLPENTLAGFKKVLDNGADGIEFDIIISDDGRAMVIHDNDIGLHAVDGASGLISEKTFEELRKIDVGEEQQIPTLEEVIEVAGRDKILNIELKSSDSAGIVVRIVNKYLENGWHKDNFLISSFNNQLLVKVREINNGLKTGLLFDQDDSLDRIPRLVNEFRPFSLHPDVRYIDEPLLMEANKNGLVVVGWTVDETVEDRDWFEKLENLSVKGYDIWVITDFPELAKK